MRQSPNVILSTRRMLWRNTAEQVRPLRSFSGSAATPAAVSLFRKTLLASTVSWPHTLSKFSWIQFGLSFLTFRKPKNISVFVVSRTLQLMPFKDQNWRCHMSSETVAIKNVTENVRFSRCSSSPSEKNVDNLFNRLEIWDDFLNDVNKTQQTEDNKLNS